MSDKIFVFQRTADTIKASKLLAAAGVEAKVISLPDWLSFECGVSLVISVDNQANAQEVLSASKITLAGIYDY